MKEQKKHVVLPLVLGGLMVALGTVLSFVKVYELPYGGSVTLCSMLPIMLFGYLCGPRWGLGAGFTYSVLQLLFGLSALKGVSGTTVVGSILLDYLLAFTLLGLTGFFRGKFKNDTVGFTVSALFTGLLRYLCSFLSGCILWGAYADATAFPILQGAEGTKLIILYSAVYNGSYMLPEVLLTCILGALVMLLTGDYLLRMLEKSRYN